ncbi:phosphatase PAP2 family protein [Sphingopyxis sp. MWB1]|uniref:phosphatase PAP2 family protein n=1 Tax=Sphingopyxis sp. MWB1 TaxID=1537715 RepID=UPI0009DE4D48|nr:phosphatase PAP2 family protein [Sphingopyxis sp. MWB1]
MSSMPLPRSHPGYDDASWLLVALCLLLLAGFQMVQPFGIRAGALVSAALVICCLQIGQYFYTAHRKRPALAALFAAMSQIILFSILGLLLSYMVAARGGALWDAELTRWDQGLGLDWLAYLGWINARPLLGNLYHWAYVTLIPQLVVLLMALAVTGRDRLLRRVACASILSGILAVLISGYFPAASNFVHLNLRPEDFPNLHPAAAYIHYADFTAVRAGSLTMLDIGTMQGIITFPSYHAALGAIFIWGFIKLGPWGWPGALWASLMLAATPVDGAHYFVDVIAGVALAVACIALSDRLVSVPWLRLLTQKRGGRRSGLNLAASN